MVSEISSKIEAFKAKYGISECAECRFWRKIKIVGDCWEWQGQLVQGYGRWKPVSDRVRIRMGLAKINQAHRAAFGLVYGEEPEVVMHLCDNPKCCNPEHLKAGTHRENALDRERKGRSFRAVGSKNGRAKLTETQVQDVRERAKQGETHKSIAQDYGMSPTSLSQIVCYRQWKHI